MTSLKHFKKTDSIKKMAEALKSDGALVIDNVLKEKFVNKLRKETDPYMEATNNGQDGFVGRLTTRTGGLVSRSEKCRELIEDNLILALCDEFLLDYCERYQLHLTQVYVFDQEKKPSPYTETVGLGVII